MREMQLFLGGQWRDGDDTLTVRSPFDGREVAKVARGGSVLLEQAVASAERATETMASLPPSERAAKPKPDLSPMARRFRRRARNATVARVYGPRMF